MKLCLPFVWSSSTKLGFPMRTLPSAARGNCSNRMRWCTCLCECVCVWICTLNCGVMVRLGSRPHATAIRIRARAGNLRSIKRGSETALLEVSPMKRLAIGEGAARKGIGVWRRRLQAQWNAISAASWWASSERSAITGLNLRRAGENDRAVLAGEQADDGHQPTNPLTNRSDGAQQREQHVVTHPSRNTVTSVCVRVVSSYYCCFFFKFQTLCTFKNMR